METMLFYLMPLRLHERIIYAIYNDTEPIKMDIDAELIRPDMK